MDLVRARVFLFFGIVFLLPPLAQAEAAAVAASTAADVEASVATTSPSETTDVPAYEAFADFADLDLEALLNPQLVGASKFVQTQSRAPASVDIITREDIRRYGYRSLAEVLRSVRGMYVTYDRNYTFLGTRGIGRNGDFNSRLLILVNGHRLNDNVWDAVLVGQDFPIDIDAIQRIEVIRGPASSLYGANAFSGIINVITRDSADYGRGEVGIEAGSYRTFKPYAAWGRTFDNGLDATLSLAAYRRSGTDLYFEEYDDPAVGDGFAVDMDRERAYRAFGSLRYKGLHVFGGFVDRLKRNPTGNYYTLFNDPRYETDDKRGFLEVAYERQVAEGATIFARSGYDYDGYVGDFPYSYAINRDRSRGDWWTNEIRVSLTDVPRNRITLGVEHKQDPRQNYLNYDVEPFAEYVRVTEHTWSIGAYLQDEIEATDWLLINVGMRFDYYDKSGPAVNPRTGIILLPTETTTVKMLYGQAFRIPTVYDEWSNPDLDVEKISSIELNLEQRIAGNFRLGVAGYRNHMRDLINEAVLDDPDGVADSGDEVFGTLNNERIETWGMESEIRGAWQRGYELRLGYEYQRSRSEPVGDEISNSPGHIGRFNGAVPLIRQGNVGNQRLLLALEAIVISPRLLHSDLTDETNTSAYLNLNLLSREWIDGLDVSLGVYNLLDRANEDPSRISHIQRVIVQDGTTLRGKVTYRF